MNNKTISSFQILRFVCFLIIFLYHTTGYGQTLAILSNICVSIFFTLSGFLLEIKYDNQSLKPVIKKCFCFIKHFFSKNYPLYFITLLACFVLNLWLLKTNSHGIDEFINFFINLPLHFLLLQSWSLNIETVFSMNGAAWFLSSLCFLYFIFPLIHNILKYFTYKRGCLLYFIFYLSYYSMIFVLHINGVEESVLCCLLYSFPIAKIIEFMGGMLLYKTIKNSKKRLLNSKNLFLFISFIIAILFTYEDVLLLSRSFMFFIDYLLIVIIYQCDKFITNEKVRKVFNYLGTMSSHMYLLHAVINNITEHLFGYFRLNISEYYFITVPLIFIITFALSFLYHNLVTNKKIVH